MEMHVLTAAQRRMLLEMLASERAGEEALLVGPHFGREEIALDLCELGFAGWSSRDELVFSDLGRHLAENLVRRLVRIDPVFDLFC